MLLLAAEFEQIFFNKWQLQQERIEPMFVNKNLRINLGLLLLSITDEDVIINIVVTTIFFP